MASAGKGLPWLVACCVSIPEFRAGLLPNRYWTIADVLSLPGKEVLTKEVEPFYRYKLGQRGDERGILRKCTGFC